VLTVILAMRLTKPQDSDNLSDAQTSKLQHDLDEVAVRTTALENRLNAEIEDMMQSIQIESSPSLLPTANRATISVHSHQQGLCHHII
jgi:hypothetical protein